MPHSSGHDAARPAAPHSFHPSILREYDVRGVYGETLSPADAYALGRGLGTLAVRAGGRLACVGRDGRDSSPALTAELVRGLAECGLEVVRIGIGPSPMLYFAQRLLAADLAVCVTASHNPPEYNGFKIVMGGKPFFGADIKRLGDLVAAGDFVRGAGTVRDEAVAERYVDRLAADWDGGTKGLKVVWDAGNGSAGEVMTALTRRLPGRHRLLFADIDGRFPNHHPDPTVPENLEALIAAVGEDGADIGIAFDGDGDRIGIVDDGGTVAWGDQILQILAEDLLKAKPGATIIADVKASQTLFDEVARMGGQAMMWKTGHSLIKTRMAETGAALAGEMSGHIFFADRYYGFDDALYAAVRLLGILARSGRPLSARLAEMPPVVNTPEIRVPCPEERKGEVVQAVRARLRDEGAAMEEIDGVRVRRDRGWWLLRASNTQAILVVRAEAGNAEDLAVLRGEIADYLGAAGLAFE